MFSLSAGNCGDGPEGRALLRQLGPTDHPVYLLMDRAYEGDETRALAVELGYIPVVPPKSNRKNPWDYDKQLYNRRILDVVEPRLICGVEIVEEIENFVALAL